MHVMLDLETWGTEPGNDLRSIGACVFDPVAGLVSIPCESCKNGQGNISMWSGDCSDCLNTRMQSGYGDTFYVATENPKGRWRNGEFVPELAKNENERMYPLTRDPETVKWWNDQSPEAQSAFSNPINLRHALLRFHEWFTMHDFERVQEIRIWANGPQMDCSMLAAAYRAVSLPVPWHYRAPRDFRTITDAAGMTREEFSNYGDAHNALHDAIAQSMTVCEAYKRLGLQK